MVWLIPGLVALIIGIILVSPFFLALLARVGAKAPIAIRLPLRDMARYRARSGSALSAISLGIMIAVIVCAVAVARYANVFDYVGPNMAANAINVYSPPPAGTQLFSRRSGPEAAPATPSVQSQEAAVHAIASAVGATHLVELDNPAGRAAEPERKRAAMERADLRGDAGAAASLRHQPFVDPLQRRRPHLAARPGRLGRPAHLRGRRQGRQRLRRPWRRWARRAMGARRARASRIRPSRRRASCPLARRPPTR